jgi:hypothetical protein
MNNLCGETHEWHMLLSYIRLSIGYIDPSIMIPRDRLLTLINQAFEWQRSNCLYHNRVKASYSLFTDHLCDK